MFQEISKQNALFLAFGAHLVCRNSMMNWLNSLDKYVSHFGVIAEIRMHAAADDSAKQALQFPGKVACARIA